VKRETERAPTQTRIIIHVDLNAFYPSVEIVQNPSLKGKPVIVGADPKGGKGRGVVVSCSYEARRYGVRSGMPISRAYSLIPDAAYIRPDFALYARVSRRVMNLLRAYADKFEQVSIDEAFLDVSDRVNGSYDSARELAISVRADLEAKEGLFCSIGVAPNKSSSKIASEFQKPDGLTVVRPEELGDFLSPLPVSSISGVGKKTEEFFNSIGVKTIGDLQRISGKQLVKYFGKTGVWLWGVAHGLEQIEVKERPMKSLGAEHTFERDVSDKAEVLAKMSELAIRVHTRVMASKIEFKVVGIKIRFTHFQTYTRENTLAFFTNDLETIRREGRNLLREFEENPRRVRLIGMFVADFREIVKSNLDLIVDS
jgi:DNA polymerase IV (archaeal DinB-like DNA polymerase)